MSTEIKLSYYERNRESIKASVKNRKERIKKEDPERFYREGKAYRDSQNKEKVRAYMSSWYQKNKESVIARHARNEKEKYRNDINFRLRGRLRWRIRYAMTGKTKPGSLTQALGCTIPELRIHLERQFTDGMSWENYGKWHIDHIIPLASFDLTSLHDFMIANHYKNLRPLWALDNLRRPKMKRNRTIRHAKV